MELAFDQAMYMPASSAEITVSDLPADAASIRATLSHIGQPVLAQHAEASARETSLVLALPSDDFTGYLLRVDALDAQGVCIATGYAGLDCCTDWKRFPRYGYVWDFTDTADAEAKIAQLSRYHLNGLQFYDWQYRHHQPVAPDTSMWTDWSGRVIDGGVLRHYLDAAHGVGMRCMAYNMVYAANLTYRTDGSGVDADWRLVKANGQDFTCEMEASLGDVGVLQYFNLLNPDWQRYIFAKENQVFDVFDFDGWHGDTIGENGRMKTADGGPLGYDEEGRPIRLVKDCYRAFLNAAKQAIGDKTLMFNPVGAQGTEQVNTSDVDVLYTEFWPWDNGSDGLPFGTYWSIHRAIDEAIEQSGGKSLIVAAYVNYRNAADAFNAPSVRLLDSVVFASGGARIELGNGDGMLSDEYFPSDRHKRMDDALQADVTRMYDFVTAYENLLRDGQRPIERKVEIDGHSVSDNGRFDTVWCFARADDSREIYHFINLCGTDAGWRDEAQTKAAPTAQTQLKTRLYTDFPVSAVCLASPDTADLSISELPFTVGEDESGAYVAFTMPSLAYWNLIFLR